MTLGRTAEGKIKIKTDGTAGLRAVECGCCVAGPCIGFGMSEAGCPSFKDLTGATAITMTHVPAYGQTVTAYLNMIAPFSSVEYVIDDGWQGVSVSGGSGLCGANLGQIAYGNHRYARWYISRKDGECVCTIETGAYGGNGGDYSYGYQGNIIVPIANIFGTHTIPETGEGCTSVMDFDADGNLIDLSYCNPIEASSTVTIS